MKIKKYIAQTMPEAMKKIRTDLGEDAVILNSKEIRTGGFLGFFTKPSLEVFAALDPDPVLSERNNDYYSPRNNIPILTNHSMGQKETLKPAHQSKTPIVADPNVRQTSQPIPFPEKITNIISHLENQGVNSKLRADLSKRLLKRWYREESEIAADDSIQKWVREEILSLLSNAAFGPFDYDKKYLNLIGPTGVGKTTTIAKIAADAVLNKKKKVAMITTDTYRIAAIDQLKTYAEILNVPLEVAYNREDFKRAQDRFKDYDVIFVDSAGRNYKRAQYVTDLQDVYQFNDEMENYLVLSLTSKYSDMKRIVDQFKNIPIKKYIFTKRDETETFGDVLNLIYETAHGVAYLTIGQNVPDDIIETTPERIVDLVLGDDQGA
ncbi:flagellar biosynthesis protein FlhF [Pseudalkalibacillus salsuginis]|uniref:flagellar biosynthesis protein FlhF n=1 Tax=Pseudalkalibacillus salsuginis TaxID=2910972 RepID=UPI001F2AD524|nr:flagellar biosynthesis protein FlhF [Pseudalkalibacillus salsuginis]MCF6410585.1 flagellar biosynthesis protein FlhF [Pseudalkalibacillus salsuginis]